MHTLRLFKSSKQITTKTIKPFFFKSTLFKHQYANLSTEHSYKYRDFHLNPQEAMNLNSHDRQLLLLASDSINKSEKPDFMIELLKTMIPISKLSPYLKGIQLIVDYLLDDTSLNQMANPEYTLVLKNLHKLDIIYGMGNKHHDILWTRISEQFQKREIHQFFYLLEFFNLGQFTCKAFWSSIAEGVNLERDKELFLIGSYSLCKVFPDLVDASRYKSIRSEDSEGLNIRDIEISYLLGDKEGLIRACDYVISSVERLSSIELFLLALKLKECNDLHLDGRVDRVLSALDIKGLNPYYRMRFNMLLFELNFLGILSSDRLNAYKAFPLIDYENKALRKGYLELMEELKNGDSRRRFVWASQREVKFMEDFSKELSLGGINIRNTYLSYFNTA